MKALSILAATLFVAAGCATDGTATLAEPECKIAPITTTSMTYGGRAKPVDSLDQRYAQMQFASTQYRYANLARHGPIDNTAEEALRNCR